MSPSKEETNIYTHDKFDDNFKYSIIQYYRVFVFSILALLRQVKNFNFRINLVQPKTALSNGQYDFSKLCKDLVKTFYKI